jgi:hypothetical protein
MRDLGSRAVKYPAVLVGCQCRKCDGPSARPTRTATSYPAITAASKARGRERICSAAARAAGITATPACRAVSRCTSSIT